MSLKEKAYEAYFEANGFKRIDLEEYVGMNVQNFAKEMPQENCLLCILVTEQEEKDEKVRGEVIDRFLNLKLQKGEYEEITNGVFKKDMEKYGLKYCFTVKIGEDNSELYQGKDGLLLLKAYSVEMKKDK